ncbi:hypothetical protein BDW02DRAFT_575276 [Decorospora gaudefroyi]|uniref:Uncharacterized protein n=1 Tax=Decorospora gaudefroyi TaxID=184978 RepID=A0A6A5KQU4_9PLEO|nr:hypothetical protein BDW02DRAFT_575276 [Decorospora gaudefroyi]
MAKINHNKLNQPRHCDNDNNHARITRLDRSASAPPTKATTESGKGWEYLDWSPVPANPIVGDVNPSSNVIKGKRNRKASNLNEVQLAKAARALKAQEDSKEKEAQAPNHGNTNLNPCATDSKTLPAPKKRGRPRKKRTASQPHNSEQEDSDTDNEFSPRHVRRQILYLVSHSLAVADTVAGYMKAVGEDVSKLERDVDAVLTESGKKRKARGVQRGEYEGKRARIGK